MISKEIINKWYQKQIFLNWKDENECLNLKAEQNKLIEDLDRLEKLNTVFDILEIELNLKLKEFKTPYGKQYILFSSSLGKIICTLSETNNKLFREILQYE